MSRIVTIEVEVRDLNAVKAACRRLGLKEPIHGKAKLFRTEAEGVIVKLPEWRFPIVCDLPNGKVHYDNYEGKWGDQKYLDRFIQAYSIEKATLEARQKCYRVVEQSLNDGSVKLTINVGGVA